jgi:shikimate kinase
MVVRMEPRRVALIGLMGAGKSRVGQLLARALGWPFSDLDRLVQEEAGMSVAGIFERETEAGFRRREAEMIARLGRTPPPLVAAMGGGVVESEDNLTVLSDGFYVVWLRVDPQEAWRRVSEARDRPLLAGPDPRGTLGRLARRRASLYARAADLVLESERRTPAEILCRRIVYRLGSGR